MNVRHVNRVSRPVLRQRAQTNAVNRAPVGWFVQRCSTTSAVATPSRSRHALQTNVGTAMGQAQGKRSVDGDQTTGLDRFPNPMVISQGLLPNGPSWDRSPSPSTIWTRLMREGSRPGHLFIERPARPMIKRWGEDARDHPISANDARRRRRFRARAWRSPAP
jgi:hypothetical protein